MYRNRVSIFNHAQSLTYGNPIGLSVLTSRFNVNPSDHIDAICSSDSDPLMAQVQYFFGERSARLNFVTPEPSADTPGFSELIEFLCIRAGELGATNLLAEVSESSQMIEEFRRCGFLIYGWETTWCLSSTRGNELSNHGSAWSRSISADENAIHTLYHTLVPPLVQAAEPYSKSAANRLVYKKKGETMAFVECLVGPKGIYLKPVIHPALEKPDEMLVELINLSQISGKPVFLQMRSYQAWLTAPLEVLGAETTVHFVLMAHRLAIPQFVTAEQHLLNLENRRTETTVPMIQKFLPKWPMVKKRHSVDN